MLSIIHKKAYKDFLDLLLRLQNNYENYEGVSPEDKSAIWKELKQVFQQRIVTLTDEDLETEVASRWISLHTEIQRGFRLLQTEWLFCQAARQTATLKAKEKSVLQHLQKLINYCQAMLTL